MNPPIYEPLDLSNQLVKEAFSKYLLFWLHTRGETLESLSSKSGFSTRQLYRYLPGPQRMLPKKIPLKTFNDLLSSIGKTYDDFYEVVIFSGGSPQGRV